jgi:NADH-quinone oxidoreductase subunit L
MIGRAATLYSHAPEAMMVVAVVGAATALVAGTIGLVQTDIKRVLAYSTVSQLGYMVLAMGVGAYAAGIFHLYTHAFFKALLFLGAGAVIHALHGEQDIRRMGGLRRSLPITYWTFLIGAAAIAGVPPLAGFFSKDEILWKTFSSGHTVLWAIGMATAFLTAVYMFRLVFLTFHGEPADAHGGAGHALGHGGAHGGGHGGHGGGLHDAPPAMAVPLIVLAIGAVLAGFIGVPHALGGHNRIEGFLEPSFHAPAHEGAAPGEAVAGAGATHEAEAAHADEGMELTLMVVSTLIALAGVGAAAYCFLWNRAAGDRIAAAAAPIHRLLANKYYVDELYDAAVIQPIKRLSDAVLWRVVDARIIDGAVNGAGAAVVRAGAGASRVQTGSMRTYAAGLLLGAVTALGYLLWR